MTNTWQQELKQGFSNVRELSEHLNLSTIDDKLLYSPDFPMRVPRGFVERMEKGNINDPLLKQILPLLDENTLHPDFSSDPVGDIEAMAEIGVIHKYYGRALLIITGACAINCRYCFRKNFPYAEFQLSSQKIAQAIKYLESNTEISEIILSGGDPLILNDNKLFNLISRLDQLKNIKRIRIHSRIPVVLPNRISNEFCRKLSTINKTVILVIHCNHANELNSNVQIVCKKILETNTRLLNQAVLLKGINDNANQLCLLSEKLFDYGVMPYYLHLLDKATGTSHFDVNKQKAIALMNQIKEQLPGYLIPKLVEEIAGAKNKIVIA